MPIVISYDDVNALGSAALQAGYQTGMASGGQSYLNRQQQDSQMLMGQAFQRHNQDRAFQQQESLQGNQQRFAAAEVGTGREFQAGQAAADRNARLQSQQFEAQLRQSQDERDYQQQLGAMQEQDKLVGARQTANREDAQLERRAIQREKEDALTRDFMSQGIPEEQARVMAARARVEEATRTGNFAPSTGRGSGGSGDNYGTRSGTWRENAFDQSQYGPGAMAEVLAAAVKSEVMEPGRGAVVQAKSGILDGLKTIDDANLSMMMRGAVPEIRVLIQAELARRGGMQYGSNQSQGQAHAAPAAAPAQQGSLPPLPPEWKHLGGEGTTGLMAEYLAEKARRGSTRFNPRD